MVDRQSSFIREMRSPRAAAVAGIAFAVLLSTAIVLLQWGLPGRGESSEWLTEESHREAVGIAMKLVPYAGIAFLWFIGVIRSRLGDQEDKLFATVFLGSGLLFVAMLFTSAAVTVALLDAYVAAEPTAAFDSRLATSLSASLLATFGIRMAAVFTLVVTNLGYRTGFAPRWLVVVGVATGAILLLAPPGTLWVSLVFPGLGVLAQRAVPGAVHALPRRRVAAGVWVAGWPAYGLKGAAAESARRPITTPILRSVPRGPDMTLGASLDEGERPGHDRGAPPGT